MAGCMECSEALAEHEDPRKPSLEVGDNVLCFQCFYDAAESRIEELIDEISRLKELQGNGLNWAEKVFG